MNELETSIVDISDSALDDLFNETPEKTVNAETLLGGKKPDTTGEAEEEEEDEDEEEQQTSTKKGKKKAEPKAQQQPQYVQDIEDVDLDDEPETEEDEEEEEDEEDTKKAKKGTKRAEKAEQEGDAEKVLDKDKSKKDDADGSAPEVLSVLKSTVDYLIQSGVWQDFEGREELDITEEVYAKLVAEQDKLRVESMFGELVDSTGPFGKAIIDFVKTGGNPDEIIDLFKEQKSVESISIEEADGQKDIIKHYYSEVLGWKPEKIEKYISNLLLSNELENEAKDVKDLFGQYYKKETDRLNAERQEFVEKQKEAEQAFESNIKTTIKDRKDLTPSERKQVEEYLLSYDQRLPNGNMVNKFYVNFAKMQANPADYIDLVLFVMDKQKFVQKVAVKEKSQAAAEAFKFIKGNGAVSTKKGTSYEQVKKNEKVSTFDWGVPTRK